MKKILIVFVFSLGLGNALQAGISMGSASAVLKQVKKVDEKTLKKKEADPNPCVRYHLPCTVLGGVISANTTWTRAKSPYRITDAVMVASGVTLAIEPGVAVYSDGPEIEVFGTLNAIGTNTQKIIFHTAVNLWEEASTSSVINVQFSTFDNASIGGGGGAVFIRDSAFKGNATINLSNPSAVCYIERNIFLAANMSVSNISGSPIYIRNNVIMVGILIQGSNPMIFEKNSFFGILQLSNYPSSQATVINNYWNTTDTAIIDSRIYDHNDDLSLNTLTYTPFLTAPDPATPAAQ